MMKRRGCLLLYGLVIKGLKPSARELAAAPAWNTKIRPFDPLS